MRTSNTLIIIYIDVKYNNQQQKVFNVPKVLLFLTGLESRPWVYKILTKNNSLHSEGHFLYWIQTFFASVKKRMASSPPSRPEPEAFMPPNGVRRSRNNQQLTHTMPVFNCLASE